MCISISYSHFVVWAWLAKVVAASFCDFVQSQHSHPESELGMFCCVFAQGSWVQHGQHGASLLDAYYPEAGKVFGLIVSSLPLQTMIFCRPSTKQPNREQVIAGAISSSAFRFSLSSRVGVSVAMEAPPGDEQIEESHAANHAQLICNDAREAGMRVGWGAKGDKLWVDPSCVARRWRTSSEIRQAMFCCESL